MILTKMGGKTWRKYCKYQEQLESYWNFHMNGDGELNWGKFER